MPPMDPLAELALRYPKVPIVLAHAGIAGQGMFASRLAGHPATLYDTSCLSPWDVIELFARVPAERVVFASDVPYGRPAFALYMALRIATHVAGLDEAGLRMLVGGTMARVLDREPLPEPRAPRVAEVRPVSGRLLRAATYLHMGFAAIVSGPDGRRDAARALPWVAQARAVCRDPDAGAAAPALERVDATLDAAERFIADGGRQAQMAIGLLHSTMVFAATEPVGGDGRPA
jgi:hypothetical protein